MSELVEFCTSNGLSVRSVFVPQSQSRNKTGLNLKEIPFNKLQLNWKVTLVYKGRDILTTDYSAGVGHAPGYKQTMGRASYPMLCICRAECETGKPHRWVSESLVLPLKKAPAIMPKEADVIHSLVTDADVMNYNSFEDWANCMGGNPDSIKEKAIYDTCLQFALALRNGLGDELFKKLQDACQDY